MVALTRFSNSRDFLFLCSFPVVVLVLKILLIQHGLDKPFTGGLGSFKLYVLVASHVSALPRLSYDCTRHSFADRHPRWIRFNNTLRLEDLPLLPKY